MIVFFAVLMLLGYVVILNVYMHGWRREVSAGSPTPGFDGAVSIIVPARNEEKGIEQCMRALLSQDHTGDYEVILVDDHSEDGTLEIVKTLFGTDSRLTVISQHDGLEGKKAALGTGIALARGEIIATVDADCIMGSSWLRTSLTEFEYDVQIATGPVLIRDVRSDLDAYQAFDLLSLSVVTGGGLNLGLHLLANGANLLFRRSAFDKVGGYRTGENFASGDDLFLLQSIAIEYGYESVAYIGSPDGVMWTQPEEDGISLIEQRTRWASKNNSLPDRSIQLIWAFVWAVNVMTLALIPLTLINAVPLTFTMGFILAKGLQEFIVLRAAAKHYSLGSLMRHFPLACAMNAIYIPVIGVKAMFAGEYAWKGRTVR